MEKCKYCGQEFSPRVKPIHEASCEKKPVEKTEESEQKPAKEPHKGSKR